MDQRRYFQAPGGWLEATTQNDSCRRLDVDLRDAFGASKGISYDVWSYADLHTSLNDKEVFDDNRIYASLAIPANSNTTSNIPTDLSLLLPLLRYLRL